jgi:hypothetical protein
MGRKSKAESTSPLTIENSKLKPSLAKERSFSSDQRNSGSGLGQGLKLRT